MGDQAPVEPAAGVDTSAEVLGSDAKPRRRNGRVLLAGLGIVGALMLAALTFGTQLDDPGPSSVDDLPTAAGLDLTDGYRPIGALGIVFEVPESWGANEVACDGSPTRDTVAFGAGRDCNVPNPPKVSSLLITSPERELVADVLAKLQLSPLQIDGIHVRASTPAYVDDLWTFAVLGPNHEVVVVRTEASSVAQHTFERLRRIPEGWVTIPLDMPHVGIAGAKDILANLGLDPVVRDVRVDGLRPGDPAGLEPPAATVVPIGERVQILRVAGS